MMYSTTNRTLPLHLTLQSASLSSRKMRQAARVIMRGLLLQVSPQSAALPRPQLEPN
jgi:hypothetical protein